MHRYEDVRTASRQRREMQPRLPRSGLDVHNVLAKGEFAEMPADFCFRSQAAPLAPDFLCDRRSRRIVDRQFKEFVRHIELFEESDHVRRRMLWQYDDDIPIGLSLLDDREKINLSAAPLEVVPDKYYRSAFRVSR